MRPKSSDLHPRVIALHQLFPYMCVLGCLVMQGLSRPSWGPREAGCLPLKDAFWQTVY